MELLLASALTDRERGEGVEEVMISPNVRLVAYGHAWHSPHAGYHTLTRFAHRVIRARPLPYALVPQRLMWRLANDVVAYDWESLATELRAGLDLILSHGCAYHVLYVENTYHYLGLLSGFRRNRLVATFHLPTWRHRELVKSHRHLQRLSAAICLGTSQMDYLARAIGRERTVFVPRGVDAAFFSPAGDADARDPDLCLFVGEHLRDFGTLRSALDRIARARPRTRCIALTQDASVSRNDTDPLVLRRHRVPEAELLRLYRTAALLLLPLQDSVSNNTAVEAMACGLPIVATDIGSIRDYVTPQCAELVPPGDAGRFAEAAIGLLDDPARLRSMSTAGRRRGLELDWAAVVRQLQAVYDAVA
jgi:phosphatidylinositol alpha-mannosyltransferase